jgi:hypothetical protein
MVWDGVFEILGLGHGQQRNICKPLDRMLQDGVGRLGFRVSDFGFVFRVWGL